MTPARECSSGYGTDGVCALLAAMRAGDLLAAPTGRPEPATVNSWSLNTDHAHGLYAKFV
jgi:hypothetical protein